MLALGVCLQCAWALDSCLPRQDHVWITTEQLIVYTKTNLMKFMNNLSATAWRLFPLARIEITFNLLRTNWFVSSRKNSIKYFVTWFHRIRTFVASKPLRVNLNPSKTKSRKCSKSAFFFDLVQNICAVRFSYLLRLSIFCKAPRDMRKFPQKCKNIARCW